MKQCRTEGDGTETERRHVRRSGESGLCSLRRYPGGIKEAASDNCKRIPHREMNSGKRHEGDCDGAVPLPGRPVCKERRGTRMKTLRLFLITLIMMLCLVPTASAEPAEAEDEWTVLFYICGSDLESKYSYATGNLTEISHVEEPVNIIPDIIMDYEEKSGILFERPGGVNVLVETGGAEQWHAQELGMHIRPDRLQTWRYEAASGTENGTFALERESPLKSMADPDTLSDFIRWGAQNYPAKKFALVLWNHGGGSATGIFIDELFNDEYMTLDELNGALKDGGVHFEAVLFDACMMANIETAAAIHEHADWMIASEELVAGKGTAVGEWLQELYYVPLADGRLLGRWICDTAMIKYADIEDIQAQTLLTWSVIDLSRAETLIKNFDTFFEYMGDFYIQYPNLLEYFAKASHLSETYGTGQEAMYDLSGILYVPLTLASVDVERQMRMQSAVADAVDYCVRGEGRPAARGISFCLPIAFDSDGLDIYAHNCPSPHYLALLDAISTWEAPDWVYEQVEKYPVILDNHEYDITLIKSISQEGTPAFSVREGRLNIGSVMCELYKLDEQTDQIIRLGTFDAYYDEELGIYRANNLLCWPAIEDVLCPLEMQQVSGEHSMLFNIPVMVDNEIMDLRCGYYFNTGRFRIYGLWEGYDSDSVLFNRNVQSLSQVSGEEYFMLYEVQKRYENERTSYVYGPEMTIYRSLEVEEIPMPPGTYYLQYIIRDAFMRPIRLDWVPMTFDGEIYRVRDGSWEGTEVLRARDR